MDGNDAVKVGFKQFVTENANILEAFPEDIRKIIIEKAKDKPY